MNKNLEAWAERFASELTYKERQVWNALCASLPNMEDVLPPVELTYKAYEMVHPDKVKVVVLGQDPYDTPGKATGLAFGMPKDWKKINSSFDNIRNECYRDTNQWIEDISLEPWAKQGVLLTNTRLTVASNKPMSHAGYGWEVFTGAVLKSLNKQKRQIAFVLWGSQAKKWGKLITNPWHHKFEASHPCKFSAHVSFKGCSHFSQVNEFLERTNQKQIRWGVKK